MHKLTKIFLNHNSGNGADFDFQHCPSDENHQILSDQTDQQVFFDFL